MDDMFERESNTENMACKQLICDQAFFFLSQVNKQFSPDGI